MDVSSPSTNSWEMEGFGLSTRDLVFVDGLSTRQLVF